MNVFFFFPFSFLYLSVCTLFRKCVFRFIFPIKLIENDPRGEFQTLTHVVIFEIEK